MAIRFSSSNPNVPSLEIDFPIGLGFGSNTGAINLEAEQVDTGLEVPSLRVVPGDTSSVLEVNKGKNVSLIGGDIDLSGGGIKAPEGRIELIAANNNQQLSLERLENGWFEANTSNTSEFANINLRNATYLDVSGNKAGNLKIGAADIKITGGSAILANTASPTDNGIEIDATGSIELKGSSGQTSGSIPPFGARGNVNEIVREAREGTRDIEGRGKTYSVNVIAADVIAANNSDGRGANIDLNANKIDVADGSTIRTVNFSELESSLRAGDIRIDSPELNVSGTDIIDNAVSTLITSTNGISKMGDLGSISINTDNLQILAGGQIKVDLFAPGTVGNIKIDAEKIAVEGFERGGFNGGQDISNSSSISTSAAFDGIEGQKAGSIEISADTIDIVKGGKITSSSFGRNSAGRIDIQANRLTLLGTDENEPFGATVISAIVARDVNPTIESTLQTNPSDGGDISIDSQQVQIYDGAAIQANSNSGKPGNIDISANDIEISGTKSNRGAFEFVGGLSTATNPTSTGDGGDIRINTNSLSLLNGSIIRAISLGSGDAGSINIDADRLEIAGVNRFADNPIESGRVSKINTDAESSNGGNVNINSESIQLDDRGRITAGSVEGDRGGNISINTENLELLDRNQITASAEGKGDGGNITIDSDTVLGLENSDITANAVGGDGGNITIDADFIVGLESRSRLTQFSDITASSELGIDGTVTVNAPDNNLGEEAVVVFTNYTREQDRRLLEKTCLNPSNSENGKLIYVGRGGIPENPRNFFGDEEIAAVEKVPTEEQTKENQDALWVEGDPIVNSNAVRIGIDGEQYLVAETKFEDVDSSICTRTTNN